MAVYTDISGTDFTRILQDYAIGAFVSAQGIAEGVENSNYLLLTDQSPFIATVYEKRVEAADLPFFLSLLQHLGQEQIPCPQPIADNEGRLFRMLEETGRPFSIVSFLEGSWPRRITVNHCKAIGDILARMHLACDDFTLWRENIMGQPHWQPLYDSMAQKQNPQLDSIREEVEQTLLRIAQHWPDDLPSGIIHADLFQDNALFQGETLTGLIDFYFACHDYFAYDLAICLNAWCFEEHNEMNITKAGALLKSYQDVRPLSQAELDALPILAQGAAMRFLLSRLYDYLHQVEGAVVTVKDPQEYLQKIRFHSHVDSLAEYGL